MSLPSLHHLDPQHPVSVLLVSPSPHLMAQRELQGRASLIGDRHVALGTPRIRFEVRKILERTTHVTADITMHMDVPFVEKDWDPIHIVVVFRIRASIHEQGTSPTSQNRRMLALHASLLFNASITPAQLEQRMQELRQTLPPPYTPSVALVSSRTEWTRPFVFDDEDRALVLYPAIDPFKQRTKQHARDVAEHIVAITQLLPDAKSILRHMGHLIIDKRVFW